MEHNGYVKKTDGTTFALEDAQARADLETAEQDIASINQSITSINLAVKPVAGFYDDVADITSDGSQITITSPKLLGVAIRMQAAKVSAAGTVEFDVYSYNSTLVGRIAIPYGADVTDASYGIGRVTLENCYWASYASEKFSSGKLNQQLDPISYKYWSSDYAEIIKIQTAAGHPAPAGFKITVIGVTSAD